MDNFDRNKDAMDCSEKTFACCADEDTNFDAEIMSDGVNFFTTYIGM